MRTCLRDDCQNSMEGMRKDAKYCSEACSSVCRKRRYRLTEEWQVARRIYAPTAAVNEKNNAFLRKYGITTKQRDKLIAKQGGRCAISICRVELNLDNWRGRDAPHIDHDHDTGEVRGILCAGCNRALGQFGDNALGVKTVLVYLTSDRALV